MSNDVVIRVRVKEDARDGFAAVGQHAEAEGQKSGEKFTSRFGTVMGRMAQLLSEPLKKAGQQIGEQIGEHGGKNFVTRFSSVMSSSRSKFSELGKTIGEHMSTTLSRSVSDSVTAGVRDSNGRLRDSRGRFISGAGSGGAGGDGDSTRGSRGGKGGDGGKADVDVDVDKQSILSRFADWGKEAAASFKESFTAGLTSFFSGDLISLLVKLLAGAAIAPLIASPLAAAINSAILLALGGGVIALGVVAAFKDPRIKGAADELKDRLGKLFEKFGGPFKGPVANFLEKLNDFITKMTPNFEHLAGVMGPLADRLGSGIIGMLQNMLPGLIDALEGSAPVIKVLADRLPDIGQALGDFFRLIAENGDDAALFFNDLITVITKVIYWTGRLISGLTEFYSMVRRVVKGAVDLFSDLWDAIHNGTDAAKTTFLNFGSYVINVFGRLLTAAIAAFGWVPGLAGKLGAAKASFADARKGINAELAKIKDKTVTIRMRTFGLAGANAAVGVAQQLALMGYASGGIVGQMPSVGQAASGGIRGGLTLVGERGPELMDVAPGSRVYSNGDSQRMAAGAGTEDLAVEVSWAGSSDPLVNGIMEGLRFKIGRKFGGNVQGALGRA